MQKLMQWSQKHPIPVVIFIIACTILALINVLSVRIDTSPKGLMVRGDDAERYYYDTVEKFSSDAITVVYIHDPDMFTPDKLQAAEDLAFDLEDVPGVMKVESIFSVTNFKSVDGMLDSSPLMDGVPETDEEAKVKQQDALNNPTMNGNLITPDGNGIALNLYIDSTQEIPNYMRDLANNIEDLIKPHEKTFETIYQMGTPYNIKTQIDFIFHDQFTLIPLSVAVILLLVVVTMRSVVGAILPIITAGTSIVWTIGFMGYFDIPITVISFIVPSLLIVIGSTEDIHIFSEYLEGLHEKKGVREKAVLYMADKLGTAVMLTAITTFFGFLSITVNEIAVLRDFGTAAAFGLLMNPLITVMVTPVYLSYFGPTQTGSREKGAIDKALDRFADIILSMIRKWKWRVLSVCLGIAVLFGYFGSQVKVDNNMVGFYKKDAEIVQKINALHDNLAGADIFFLRINGIVPNAFRKPENLKKVEQLKKYMEEKGWFDKAITYTDYLKQINQHMNGGDPKNFKLPELEATVSEYNLFLQRDEIETYVTPGYDELNILVRHNNHSSFVLNKIVDELLEKAREIFPEKFEINVTGELIRLNQAVDSIVTGQIMSIGLICIVIFTIMSTLFMNVKAGYLSLIPNLSPVAMNFGVMYLLDIPLDTGTCMVSAIALGVAVDDTIHFMARYHKEMRELQDQDKAMEVCIKTEIRPVFCSSMALGIGFGVLIFSQFTPIIFFGFLSAITMLFAFIGDMFITPILLSSTQLITLWDMAGLNLRKEVLEDSKLFANMKPRQVKKVVLLGKLVEKKKGDLAVTEGEHGHTMYIILDGQAKVFATDAATGKEIVFSTLGAGDIFGEIALVEPGPRTANVMAESDLSYIEIDWAGLKRIQRVFPWVAGTLFLNISRILGQRLAHTTKMLEHKSG